MNLIHKDNNGRGYFQRDLLANSQGKKRDNQMIKWEMGIIASPWISLLHLIIVIKNRRFWSLKSIISNCHDCIVSEGNETHNRAHISSASIFSMCSKGNKTEWTLKHTNRQIAYSKKSNKHKEPEMKSNGTRIRCYEQCFWPFGRSGKRIWCQASRRTKDKKKEQRTEILLWFNFVNKIWSLIFYKSDELYMFSLLSLISEMILCIIYVLSFSVMPSSDVQGLLNTK